MNAMDENLPVGAFDGVKGKTFLYPSAGSDWAQPFNLFAPHVNELIFVDINYKFVSVKPLIFEGWEECSEEAQLIGPAIYKMRHVHNGKAKYRDIEPAWLKQKFIHLDTGKQVTVTRRRGFGQCAIDEIPNSSLGVFFHRGDSMGEGGSGVIYLGNRKLKHSPLSQVLDNLKRKLAFPALIASDGSNSDIKHLGRVARDSLSELSEFSQFGLRWKQVMRIPWRIGDTVLWRVTLE